MRELLKEREIERQKERERNNERVVQCAHEKKL